MADPRRRGGRGAALGLASRLLLLVVPGVVLPLGLVGLWLARAAERSGQELLRARLDESLLEMAGLAGTNWVEVRSELLELGLAWSDGTGVEESGRAARGVESHWGRLLGRVERAELAATAGGRRALLERGATDGAAPATVPLSLPIHDHTGREMAALTAWVRTTALLPADRLLPGAAGSLLGVFTDGGRTAAIPLGVDAELLLTPRFRWNEEDWVSVQRGLSEPPLLLVLAGPVEPFTAPFAQAAGRGTVALLLALAGSSLLVVAVTRRATRPLVELAAAADAVSQGELTRSVEENGPAEVRRLGRAFNTMTESLRRTLARLSQREAVAAVGEFASALAHEVRNPLTSIRLDLQRAAERLPTDGRPRELVERALGEVRRLDATVAGALRIARTGHLELHSLDPAGPTAAAVAAAGGRFQERCAILEPLLPYGRPIRVRADAAALEQVLLNLLLNAADALGPGGRARLVLRETPEQVRLSVEDEGEGIPAERALRVFEPFFTTRAEGTGLGLPVARRIVRAMDGELELTARPGGGTIATVVLPRAEGTV